MRSSKSTIVIYSSIFGGYDKMVRPPATMSLRDTASWKLLSDGKSLCPPPYELRIVPQVGTPRRAARRCKILSHEMFPNADATIFHSGNVQLRGDLNELLSLAEDSGIAVLKHSLRDCAYDEAKACIGAQLDDADVIRSQMKRYRDEGFPAHYGLSAGFLIVRYNRPTITDFNNLWWNQLSHGSVRDQTSIDYCFWKLGIKAAIIPGDIFDGPYHKRFPSHSKRG